MEHMEAVEWTEVRTPRGKRAVMGTRVGTSDLATVGSTFELWGNLHDEYGTAGISTDGVFVDVGAHIGSVAIAVLLDNPKARAICVEPLPENVELLWTNAERNGVADRLQIVEKAAGKGRRVAVRYGKDEHRYIANIRGATGEFVETDAVTLASLLRLAGGRIDHLKTDCEGGEYALFGEASRATLAKVGRIVGEYHGGAGDIVHALAPTHEVTIHPSADQYVGAFVAVPR